MEFYNSKDLEYWRKQAAIGKAVIIEIPMEMLLAGLSADQKVSWIMEHTEFTEEQIGIIAEAMSQELPAKYLLCFMKKEYSPAVMRQLKDYCTKMFREERRE